MKTTRFLFAALLAVATLAPLTAADAAKADADFAALTVLKAAKPPGTMKEMGAEKYYRWIDESRQQTSAAAVAFYEANPTDVRRWDAVMTASGAAPLFVKSVGADVETKGTAAIVADDAAKAAWEAKMNDLKAALLASSDAPATAREQIEWGNFARDFRATTTAKGKGEPYTYEPFRARFAAHTAKYAALPNLPARAADYLGALESNMAGEGKKEWTALLDSPNEGLRKRATEQLAKFEKVAAADSKPLELAFTAVDGRAVDVAKLRGKVVLVDFWATWCGPCIGELPNVKKVYAAYHDKGFEIIGISLDRDTDRQKLIDFTAKEGMPWPQHYDGKYWKNEVAVKYDINAIPAMFLLDQDGKIVSRSARGPALEAEVKRLLKL